MKLWQQLKTQSRATLNELLEAPAGLRFLRHYERQQIRASEHPVLRVLKVLLALLFLTLGLILGFLPLLPGWVFGVLGMALLGSQFRFFAVLLDRLELLIRRMLHKFGWSKNRS